MEKAAEFITFRMGADANGTVVRIPARNVRAVRIDDTPTPPAAPPPERPAPTPVPAAAVGVAPTSAPAIGKTPAPAPPAIPAPAPARSPVPPSPPKPSTTAAVQSPVSPAKGNSQTRLEIDALISKAGSTPPDWWDSVPLRYPPTLNLTWAKPPNGEWNAQKNLGQYIWDIVNPNPPRWREGARLLHHVLTLNRNDQKALYQTIEALARTYQNLLQDWARAAFWWRKAAQVGGYDIEDFALELGECYWKLGSRDMAVQALSALPFDETRNGNLIKLWSDMGDLNKALRLAEDKARNDRPDPAYLAAGDACRLAGRHQEALAYYRKVLLVRGDQGDVKRNRERAQANIEAIKVFDALDLSRIPDGTYRSVSPAYAGPLHVEVAVKGGRIESVKVTRHEEKQFYSAISDTTNQIIAKQGVKGVDMTSGATITAEAIVNATAKALAGGMK